MTFPGKNNRLNTSIAGFYLFPPSVEHSGNFPGENDIISAMKKIDTQRMRTKEVPTFK
jgi:hypothetical protein